MVALNYWYHAQIRQYLQQIVRVFSHFQVRTGIGRNGTVSMYRVPIRYADMTRLVGHTLRGNTENAVQSAPFMTVQISSLTMAPTRRQNPKHVSDVHMVERHFDRETQSYTGEAGNRYTVERYMPVPYDLIFEIHIWTTSTDHKLQLLEQIMTIFNPSLDIQTSTNPIDWTSLTYIEMQDTITWSDRATPVGTDETTLDIARFSFLTPIWLNPPARVHRQRLIHQIVTSLMETSVDDREDPDDVGFEWVNEQMMGRLVVTPGDHRILVENGIATLLTYGGDATVDDELLEWGPLLAEYGQFEPGVSELRLKTTPDLHDWSDDIVARIVRIADAPNALELNIDPDTLPNPTLPPIHAVIDPHRSVPGNGLPLPREGQRYLLVASLSNSQEWGELEAEAEDIIEFYDGRWNVSYSPRLIVGEQVVQNLYDFSYLRWTETEWVDIIDGEYFPGFWRILF